MQFQRKSNLNPDNKINVEIRIKPSLESSLETTPSSLQVGTKKYHFSKVHLTTTQKQLFDFSIMPLLKKFLDGYNCTVLAYGQTGSGKTYTMGISHDDTTGVLPQTLKHLMGLNLNLSCTFIEVYNEEVIDLLTEHKVPLNLREIKGDVCIAGAQEINLSNYQDTLLLLKKGCLERTTKSTKMNSQSSRSHAIFTIFLNQPHENGFVSSKFSFVDLAGSERLKRTLCTGDRARESISINSGLLALGNVISALYHKKIHIPFRDSKLTRILQSCLNGNVLMIACVSSIHTDINETNNTLKYANRAASISVDIKRNVEVDTSKYELIRLRKQIQTLSSENQILKERIKKAEHTSIEELVKENRRLRNLIEKQENVGDSKSEDLAQAIVKHPFVQNLINENDKLLKQINDIQMSNEYLNNQFDKVDLGRREWEQTSNVIKIENTSPQFQSSHEFSNNTKNDHELPENKNITLNREYNTDSKKDHEYTENKNITLNREYNSDTKNNYITLNREYNTDSKITWGKKDKCNVLPVTPNINIQQINNEDIKQDLSPAIIVNEAHSNRPKLKKHVTFDISPPKKKSSLWTPRKEKILMDTIVKDKTVGYIAQNMAIFQDNLVFSSLDNKIRVINEKNVTDLLSDSGIKCLIGDDTLFYSTRMILKQFDTRINSSSPIHAYRNEISCLKKVDNLIYTGHEDGSLSSVDIRNHAVKSEKIHSGTIFSIESFKNILYTGSRDHCIKQIDFRHSTRLTLCPPHYDSVQSLFTYKNDLISLSRDCSLKRWREGILIKTVPSAHSSWIKCGLSLDDCFITGSKNGTLRYWDYCNESVFCVGSYKIGGGVNCMVRYKNGVYVGGQNKEIVYLESKYKE